MECVGQWIGVALLAVMTCGCAEPLAGITVSNEQNEAVQPSTKAVPFDGNTLNIPLELPAEVTGAGGLVAANITGSDQREIIISQPGYITAYDLTNGKLWSKTADIRLTDNANGKGLPGQSAPGFQVGDIDSDGDIEILYVTEGNQLEVLSGASGEQKYRVSLPGTESAFGVWEQAIVANFSGEGDLDLLLQASQVTDKDDFFHDNIQAAFQIEDLLSLEENAQPLWRENNFVSLGHGAAKVVDLDGDGKDEVVGAMVLGPDGRVRYRTGIKNTAYPHLDSIAIGDIRPDRPGLEVVVPEENGKERVFLFNAEKTIWVSPHRRQTPDNDGDKVVIGDFDPDRPGLEMWFRGDHSVHFSVLDASGDVITDYAFSDRKPENWTDSGFSMINRIRWSGDDKDYIAAKERHEAGDIGVFDAITGELIVQMPAQTRRLYVVDILGDWREEMVVLENNEIKIFENTRPNPNPDKPRLWEQAHYRQQKMTWDYYSP